MPQTISKDGVDALIARECAISGLYDDSSGYATYGVGHLVHPHDKWQSFLLYTANTNDICSVNILTKHIGRIEIDYLERGVLTSAELGQLKTKAIENAAGIIGKRKFGDEWKNLTAKQQATAQGLAETAVDREIYLLGIPVSDELVHDLAKYEKAVRNNVDVTLAQDEYDALVSFVFNVGPGNFESSTLLDLVNAGGIHKGTIAEREQAIRAVEAAFLAWNKSRGRVVRGLTIRRQGEADQFLGPARQELLRLYTTSPQSGQTMPATLLRGVLS